MEGVNYIESKTDDAFHLKVNFPPIVQILVEHFRSITLSYNATTLGCSWDSHYILFMQKDNPLQFLMCKQNGHCSPQHSCVCPANVHEDKFHVKNNTQ